MASEEDTDPDEKPARKRFELEPSALDEMTHAETRILYAESTETLRFIKGHQWKTVGATLMTFLGLVFIAGFVNGGHALTNKFMAITILLATAAIFTLMIYQFWMHNEARKIDLIASQFSNLFRRVRAVKSTREGNLHRYTLLIFMVISVALGAVVVHLALDAIATA